MSKHYQIKEDVFFDENSEGIYVLSPSGDTLILDDPVAKMVWSLLSNEIAHKSLVEEIMSACNLDHSMFHEVDEDIKIFLKELEAHGLIWIKSNVTN